MHSMAIGGGVMAFYVKLLFPNFQGRQCSRYSNGDLVLSCHMLVTLIHKQP